MDVLRTGGKINFFLHIRGLRSDGYHELDTLFLPLPEPWDELCIRPLPGEGLRVRCDRDDVDPAHNTLTRAYALFAERSGYAPALDIELRKGIPSGAGLGGGSADAALLLNWLQGRAPQTLACDELVALAARVGADVPFFLNPRPSVARGIGEKLERVDPGLQGFFLVLLCPSLRVNTAWAFQQWDDRRDEWRDAQRKTFANLSLTEEEQVDKKDRSHASFPPVLPELRNDFEPVLFRAFPELGRFKAALFREGAVAAGMSGSGSALFGLFRSGDEAAQAVKALSAKGSGADFSLYGPMALGD